jgi:hypothetical protein
MVANAGPQEDSSSEAESAEGPSAVATMTRLIRSLYAVTGSYAAIRGGRDSDLIIWSEMLGVVQDRNSPTEPTVPCTD